MNNTYDKTNIYIYTYVIIYVWLPIHISTFIYFQFVIPSYCKNEFKKKMSNTSFEINTTSFYLCELRHTAFAQHLLLPEPSKKKLPVSTLTGLPYTQHISFTKVGQHCQGLGTAHRDGQLDHCFVQYRQIVLQAKC